MSQEVRTNILIKLQRKTMTSNFGIKDSYLILIILQILLSLLNIVSTSDYGNSDIVVTTPSGDIRGKLVKVAGTDTLVAEFLGIPYAEPPVDELRFSDPVLKKKWKGVYEALRFGNSCMQINQSSVFGEAFDKTFAPPEGMSEDCLYLNIWAPYPLTKPRAVMIWIHGGSFFLGNSAVEEYNGKTLAGNNDIIIVTINYRIGAFGFLASGDGTIKGNFGLKDQLQALKWVHTNIASFKGDPDSITLFGASAGSVSVGFLMITPLNNIVQNGILQSGTPNVYWSMMSHKIAQERFLKFAHKVKCNSSKDVRKCLRNLPAAKILENEFIVKGINWLPIIDGEMILDTSINMLQNLSTTRRKLLIGVNKNEAKLFLALGKTFSEAVNNKTREEYLTFIENWLQEYSPEILEVIKYLYVDWIHPNSSQNNYDNLDKLYSDRDFICPALEWNELLSEMGYDIYFYLMSYRSSVEILPEDVGATHTIEIPWIFGMPLNKSLGYSKKELQLSRKIMKFWTNFAKYGDPNYKNKISDVFWPKFQKYGKNYLEISSCGNVTSGINFRTEPCAFWNQVLSRLQNITEIRKC